MGSDSLNPRPQSNRFSPRPPRAGYSNKSEYLKALSTQISPDVWDLIVARAVQDATLGKPQQRAKAREWLARHVLPVKTDTELQAEPRADYDLLVRVYRIFEQRAANDDDVVNALAATFGTLSPEERKTLRSAIQLADSEEIQSFWVDARQTIRSESSNTL